MWHHTVSRSVPAMIDRFVLRVLICYFLCFHMHASMSSSASNLEVLEGFNQKLTQSREELLLIQRRM